MLLKEKTNKQQQKRKTKNLKAKQTKDFGGFLFLILLSFTARPGTTTEAAVTVATRAGHEEMLASCGHFF